MQGATGVIRRGLTCIKRREAVLLRNPAYGIRRSRFSNSAFVSTLTLDSAMAAPATTGLR